MPPNWVLHTHPLPQWSLLSFSQCTLLNSHKARRCVRTLTQTYAFCFLCILKYRFKTLPVLSSSNLGAIYLFLLFSPLSRKLNIEGFCLYQTIAKRCNFLQKLFYGWGCTFSFIRNSTSAFLVLFCHLVHERTDKSWSTRTHVYTPWTQTCKMSVILCFDCQMPDTEHTF